jgi:hypothetical protein
MQEPGSTKGALQTFSVGVEFLIDANDADDARLIVSNFVDAFPNEVDAELSPDVIVQDVTVPE